MLQADILGHIDRGELASFPEWSSTKAIMFVGPGDIVAAEAAEMAESDAHRWTMPPEIGDYPNSNLIHQAYHLFQWEQYTGKRVSDLSRIVEIGGGYGAMCRVCRHLGFEGDYIIHDLPAFTDLQYYYLKQTSTRAMLYTNPIPYPYDLLIGLFSLSEMDDDAQSRYLNTIRYRHFLIGLNNAPWHGVEVNHRLNQHFLGGEWIASKWLDGRYYLIG